MAIGEKTDMNPALYCKAECPTLSRNRPEDMELMKKLYKSIDRRLVGIGKDMEEAKCESITIYIGKSAEGVLRSAD